MQDDHVGNEKCAWQALLGDQIAAFRGLCGELAYASTLIKRHTALPSRAIHRQQALRPNCESRLISVVRPGEEDILEADAPLWRRCNRRSKDKSAV